MSSFSTAVPDLARRPAMRRGGLTILLLLMWRGHLAMAADLDVAADVGSARGAIEEITVSAQRREERIQDVPVSVIAVNAARLEQANVRDVKDLPRLVPNFSVQEAAQAAGLRLEVRGIGTFSNAAIEPSVAPFLDGIYVPRPGALFTSFLDIASVEVLRGPQGTLFGRNASVGAVVLHTGAPQDQFGGAVKAELGSGDRYRLEGYTNVPVSERVAVRVAVLGQLFGGYWHNTLQNLDFGGLDQVAARFSAKTAISDDVTWLARAEYSYANGTQYPNFPLDYRSVTSAGFAAMAARLNGNIPSPTGFASSNNNYMPPDFGGHDKQWALSSDLTWTLSSGLTLKLLTGYRDWRNDSRDAGTAFLPVPILTRYANYDSTSYSNEFQVLSPKNWLMNGRFDGIAGLYYFHENYALGEINTQLSQFCPLVVATASPGLVSACTTGSPTLTNGSFGQTTWSFATYAQGRYGITDTIDLTLGGRWTKDTKHGWFRQLVPNPAGVILRAAENTSLEFNQGKATWHAGLSWKPTDGIMLFSTFSTGYKSGGFNSAGNTTPLGQRRLFGPESTKNFEAGAKTSWLGGRLLANATLYVMDIDGYQDRSFDGIGLVIRNVGSLRHEGAEVEVEAQATSNLRLNFAGAYLHSRFTSFKGASNLPGLPGTQDLTGGYAHFAPAWTGSAGFEYDHESFGLPWSLRSDVSFQSRSNVGSSVDNNPQTFQAGYALLSARLTVRTPDERWTFAVFGENLTDKGYSVSDFYQTFDTVLGLRSAGATGVRLTVGNPRTIGGSATYKF